jgi:hypothetical protein
VGEAPILHLPFCLLHFLRASASVFQIVLTVASRHSVGIAGRPAAHALTFDEPPIYSAPRQSPGRTPTAAYSIAAPRAPCLFP